jgi:signal transduction histidine kinase
LLTLARGERGVGATEPVDLADVAGDAVSELAGELSGLDVRTSLLPAPTTGDADLLAHVAGNLVANAARYNRGGGWVEVQTSTDADGRAVLSVANSGEVVPAGAVDALFEPFRRLGADRTRSASGSGLGLSIVRAIVDSHGGAVALSPLDGGGLRATVTL